MTQQTPHTGKPMNAISGRLVFLLYREISDRYGITFDVIGVFSSAQKAQDAGRIYTHRTYVTPRTIDAIESKPRAAIALALNSGGVPDSRGSSQDSGVGGRGE